MNACFQHCFITWEDAAGLSSAGCGPHVAGWFRKSKEVRVATAVTPEEHRWRRGQKANKRPSGAGPLSVSKDLVFIIGELGSHWKV